MSTSNQFATVTEQPTVFQNERKNVGEKHKHIYKRLGIIQICLGVSAITLAIINIIIASSSGLRSGDISFVAAGIWGGVMILVCGILGRVSWKKPRYCPIIAAMVLTIITSLVCAAFIAVEISAAVVAGESRYCYYYGYDEHRIQCNSARPALIVFHYILGLLGLAAFVTAIVHSAYCCASVCCGRKTNQPHNVVYSTANGQQQAGVQVGVQYYPQVQTQYPAVAQQHITPQPVNQMPPPQASTQGPSQPADHPPPYAPVQDYQQNEEKNPL